MAGLYRVTEALTLSTGFDFVLVLPSCASLLVVRVAFDRIKSAPRKSKSWLAGWLAGFSLGGGSAGGRGLGEFPTGGQMVHRF